MPKFPETTPSYIIQEIENRLGRDKQGNFVFAYHGQRKDLAEEFQVSPETVARIKKGRHRHNRRRGGIDKSSQV